MGDKIDKISDALEDREYKKTSQRLNETSNGGLGDDIGSAIETAGNKVNQVGETVENVGKSIETTGKGIENAGKVVETTGKGVETTGKGMQSAGKGMQATGKAMQTTGQGMKTAGEVATPTGQAATEAGSGMVEGGAALSGTGVGAIAGVPLIIAGIGTAGVGAGTTVAGTASTIGGTAMEGAGKGVEAAGEGMEKGGEGVEKAGQNIQKAGNKMQDAGKKVQDTGKSVQDTGKKISEGGRKLRNKGVKFREAASSEDYGDAAVDKTVNAGKMAGKAVKKAIKDKKKEMKAMADMMNSLNPATQLKGMFQYNFIQIKKRIIFISLFLIIGLVIFSFIYEMALGPIMEALDKIDQAATDAANFHERMDNFLSGLGFQDSEEAFYDELEYLNTKYQKQLDIPLIMATLFYDDIQHNGETLDNGIEDAPEDDGSGGIFGLGVSASSIVSWTKDKIKDSNVTVGEDGLEYSSNKIYRLRKLAKHSFATGMFGMAAKKKDEKVVSLTEYVDLCKEQMGNELKKTFDELPAFATLINPANAMESLKEVLFDHEMFSTTDTGAFFTDNSLTHLLELYKQTFLNNFTDVESVGLCMFMKDSDGNDTSQLETTDNDVSLDYDANGNELNTEKTRKNKKKFICVKYKTYQADAEAYKNYLKKYYIRYMPEFKKYINDKDEETLNKSIDDVIEDIENLKSEYESIFGVTEQNSEYYSNICQGNIKKSLLTELVKPVDIPEDKEICFSGSYGYGTGGSLNHRGLDVNKSTTGNDTGDPVYSVYSNGKVTKSSKDKKFKCDDCKGGWLEIEYDAQLSDGAYKFKAIYGGLDPNSISLKTGDVVQKGDTIGKIGGKDDSDADIASLHFGMYDLSTNQYLDPTNLFIECVSYSGKYSISQYPNAEKVANAISSSTELDDRYKDTDHIAAILANLNVESVGFAISDVNPEAIELGVGEWNGGIGISQWTSGRNTNIRSYAEKQGSTWRDIDVQVKFLLAEFNPNGGADGLASFEWLFNSALEAFLSSTNAELATEAYANKFERCGDCHMNERKALVSQWKSILEGSQSGDSSSTNKTSKTSSCYTGSQANTGGQTGAKDKTDQEKLQIVFPNGIPTSDAEVEKYLTDVTCETISGSLSVQVHKAIAQDVIAACNAAKAEGFNIYSIGGYRSYTGEAQDSAGTKPDIGLVSSQHGYGLAVDINPTDNGQFKNGVATGNWDYKPNDPSKKDVTITESSAIYKSFESNGWGWGGHFNSSKDYMHFSFFGT